MKTSRRAFTVLELLAVIGTVAILFLFVAPVVLPGKRGPHGSRIKCVNNLKNVGLAYRIYATDNNDFFPWQTTGTNGEVRVQYLADPSIYIKAVSNELSTPKIVVCREDDRKEATNWTEFSRNNLSYFVSPDASETFPNSFMAGDRNITNRHGRLGPGLNLLSTRAGSVAGWDKTIHKEQGNMCMGDGSVQQLSSARLREQLRNTGLSLSNITVSVP